MLAFESAEITPTTVVTSTPFAEILLPLAVHTSASFFSCMPSCMRALLSDQARIDIRTSLLEELCHITHHVLYHELQRFESLNAPRTKVCFARLSGKRSPDTYMRFVKSIGTNAGGTLFQKYPVLSELVALRSEYWKRTVMQLLRAFSRDREQLTELLGHDSSARIESLATGLSDSHNRGRSVAILTCTNGHKIVCKPRPLSLEARFMKVLEYLNGVSEEKPFRLIRMLPKRGYGWCEFIQHSKNDDANSAERYYKRSGYLLAALHAFRATDCHFENLIAADGFPVIGDLETLCHADHTLDRPSSGDESNDSALYSSVSRVGLLPIIRTHGNELDLSGFGANLEQQSVLRRTYQHSAGREVVLDDRISPLSADETLPSHQPIDREVMVAAIEQGFQAGYELLLSHRDVLLNTPSLIPSFRGTSCRFVARPTRTYSWLLQKGLDQSALRDSELRSREHDRLFRAGKSPGTQWWRVAEFEREMLMQLDIPHFSVPLNSRDLRAGRATVLRRAFKSSPYALLRRRMQRLSKRDCAIQMQVISLSFAQKNTSATRRCSNRPIPLATLPETNAIVSVVEAIAQRTDSLKIAGAGHAPSWLSLGPSDQQGVYRLQPCGSGLYQGRAGIAIFYAALFAVTKNPLYEERSREALLLGVDDISTQSRDGFDLGEGSTGRAYAHSVVGQLLGDPHMSSRALRIILSVSDDSLSAAKNPDLISGLAGYLLTLTAVVPRRPSPQITAKLRLVAQRIVQLAEPFGASCVRWKTQNEEYLPGMAHGAAGIALSLARAGRFLEDTHLISAALSGFRYVEEVYDSEIHNWRDLRKFTGNSPLPPSWCHGAVGIGLAMMGDPDFQAQCGSTFVKRISDILSNQCSVGTEIDSMCCGVAGALEWLVGGYTQKDRLLLGGVLTHLLSSKYFRSLPENGATIRLPGLFVGEAGIGYQLLRVAYPKLLPSVLTLGGFPQK